MQQLSFEENGFKYEIELNPTANILKIKGVHIEEYCIWEKTIQGKIDLDKKTPGDFNFELEPNNIFALLEQYINKKLPTVYCIKFPIKFEDPETELTIELITSLPTIGRDNHKPIYLQPVEVEISDKINNKIANTKKNFEDKLNVEINKIEDRFVLDSDLDTELKNIWTDLINFKKISDEFKKENDTVKVQLIALKTEIATVKAENIALKDEFKKQNDAVRVQLIALNTETGTVKAENIALKNELPKYQLKA